MILIDAEKTFDKTREKKRLKKKKTLTLQLGKDRQKNGGHNQMIKVSIICDEIYRSHVSLLNIIMTWS
jgi:hypothetical protein